MFYVTLYLFIYIFLQNKLNNILKSNKELLVWRKSGTFLSESVQELATLV